MTKTVDIIKDKAKEYEAYAEREQLNHPTVHKQVTDWFQRLSTELDLIEKFYTINWSQRKYNEMVICFTAKDTECAYLTTITFPHLAYTGGDADWDRAMRGI